MLNASLHYLGGYPTWKTSKHREQGTKSKHRNRTHPERHAAIHIKRNIYPGHASEIQAKSPGEANGEGQSRFLLVYQSSECGKTGEDDPPPLKRCECGDRESASDGRKAESG